MQKANSARFSCKPGTTKWSPPEVLRCIKSRDYYLEHPFKADVYSFGLIAYEVLTGLMIFNEAAPSLEKLKEQIMANDFSQYFTSFDGEKDKYPESFISFMTRCWAFKPTERPNFHEIIENIKDARSSLITRSSETPVTSKTRWLTRTVEKVTHRKTSKTTKTSKISVRPFLRPCPRPRLMVTEMGHDQYVDGVARPFNFILVSLFLLVFVSQTSIANFVWRSFSK